MEKTENEDISLNKDEIVGFAVHDLSKRFKTFLQKLNEEEDADPAAVSHGWLIGYLYDNRDKVIYQRDLEIADRYGVKQVVGDIVGPAGIFRLTQTGGRK